MYYSLRCHGTSEPYVQRVIPFSIGRAAARFRYCTDKWAGGILQACLPRLRLVACRREFVTASAEGRCFDARMLVLSEQRFALVTVTTDAESGNGCSATGHYRAGKSVEEEEPNMNR
jgi:hypothetical protein